MGYTSSLNAITPTFAVSPLSPDRACASFTSCTFIDFSCYLSVGEANISSMFAYVRAIRKCVGILVIAACLGFLTTAVRCQPNQKQAPLSTDEIILRAAKETKRYRDEFKNLLAKETKTI